MGVRKGRPGVRDVDGRFVMRVDVLLAVGVCCAVSLVRMGDLWFEGVRGMGLRVELFA